MTSRLDPHQRFRFPEDSAFMPCPSCGLPVSKRLRVCQDCAEKRRAESIDMLGAAVVCLLLGFVALLLMLAT